MNVKAVSVGELGTNCYIVYNDNTGIIIDPGDQGEKIWRVVCELGISVSTVILTHYHFDHVGAVDYVCQMTGAKLAIGEHDSDSYQNPPSIFSFAKPPVKKIDILLHDGDEITIGSDKLKVLHTPGHTPGGISLIGENFAFCGDTLFCESVGRTDFPGGSFTEERASVMKLLELKNETVLYCGHGPSTTVMHEKKYNPYL